MTLNPTSTSTSCPHRRRAKKALLIVAAIATAGAVAAFTATSFGQGYGPGNGPGPGYGPGFGRGMGPGMGPGFGRGDDGPGFGRGWGRGPGSWSGGTFDPARAEARVDRMVRHFAVELGASGDQQEKLATIAKAAIKDVLPLREKMFAAHQQARDLLTAQTIDRAALEKLRADQSAARDAASKRVVQALADAAEVLTPDQRTKLKELIASRQGGGWGYGRGRGMMGGGWGRGMMGGWGGGWGWR